MDAAVDALEADGLGATTTLEKALQRVLISLGREIMESLLSSEAAQETYYDKKPTERNAGKHPVTITTLFGDIKGISRQYYYDAKKRDGHYPFDDLLGLRSGYTPAIVEEMLRISVDKPYEEASLDFEHHFHFSLSKDIINRTVVDMMPEITKMINENPPNYDSCRGLTVYVLADGTGVPFKAKYLKGVKGKNGDAKTKEAKMGAIFLGGIDLEGKPYRLSDSTTYVSSFGDWEVFGRKLRNEFNRRFKDLPARVVFISDGSKWLKSVRDNFFPFAKMVLDLFHACEHLKPLMLELGFVEKTEEWKSKHKYWTDRIKEGRIDLVIKAAQKIKPKTKIKELKYFRENVYRMKYDKYRAKGWFVGSGVIESGCKIVVGQRFKCSGMNWSERGAKPLLELRSLSKSGRLKEFFAFLQKDVRQLLPEHRCA